MHKIVDGLLRENDGRRVPVTLFTKAADSGWKPWQKPVAMRWASTGPVSYTHLRAHETRHDLVCRLLLEKKKKNQE